MTDKLNTRFSFDEQSQDNAKIKVVGIGGGGGNAINNMIQKGLDNVEYLALNTDNQALKNNMANITLQVGKSLTNGLGAGARPEIGREAVEENRHDIEESIEGADMVFVTAGMGGGTGTGGAPVVAGIAKRKGILTVGIITTPFHCEGRIRMKYAMEGINELKKNCDTLIVIPNERLLDICDDNTTMMEAFEQANEVLYNATRGISDLILMPGLINLDFADIRTTMIDGGAAIMGSATADGPDRAEIAAREAINSPLLDGVSIRGARNVLVNISAGSNLGMREATKATSIIQQEAGDDAEIIMGTVLDENYGEEMRVTVIATGFELGQDQVRPQAVKQTREPVQKPRQQVEQAEARPAKPAVAPAAEVAARTSGRSSLPSADQIPVRAARSTDSYYKGEKNLKQLDTPAFLRRSSTVHQMPDRVARDQSDLEKPSQRILKGEDTRDQPAFLRKIMD